MLTGYYLRSLVFNIISVIFTTCLFISCLPVLLLKNKNPAKKVTIIWVKGLLFLVKIICGITIKINGEHLIPKDKRFILASKHSSVWETLFFQGYFNAACYILKKELFSIPILGWFAKAVGMIGIDRTKGASALKLISQKVKTVETLPVIIFPQGTRVLYDKDYSTEKYPYKQGVYVVSKISGMKVLAATHNAHKYWGRGYFSLKKAGVIEVTFCDFCQELKTIDDFNALVNNIEKNTLNLL